MEFAHLLQWPVQWGDQDAFAHVNNVIFARYSETGRVEYLNSLGELPPDRVPVIAALTLEFRRPLRYPDVVRIETAVSRFGRTSMTVVQRMSSTAQAAVVCETTATVVFLTPKGEPAALPESMKTMIRERERAAGRTVVEG